MKQFLYKNRFTLPLMVIAVLLTTIGLSYAFMSNDTLVTTDGNAIAQVITGDGYTLEHVRSISGPTDVSGTNYTLVDMSSDVTLTADVIIDTTYNLYYNVKVNNYLDETTTPTAKIIVKFYNPSGEEITSLDGLTRVTAGSITGFDLTNYSGSIELAKAHSISTNTSLTHNWQVKVYLYDTSGLSDVSNTLFDSEINIEEHNKCWGLTNARELILCHNGGKAAIEAKGDPDFTQIASTNEGMFAAPDTYGTAYYYRGAVDNNWLLFNGIYWRIVSIAGDGSLKLLYSGTTAPTESQAVVMTGSGTQIGISNFDSGGNVGNTSVGYMYTSNELHGLGTSSTIKLEIESWYTNTMSSVDSQIEDNLFCYDRSLAKSGYQDADYGTAGGIYTGTGIGISGTLYGAASRITASSSTWEPGGSGPELVCPNIADAYTVSDETNGNGALSNKVGILNVDEVVMAGVVIKNSNTSNYLVVDSNYWLGTPFGFNANPSYWVADIWNMSSTGRLAYNYNYSPIGMRPVIYLTSEVDITGTGEWNNIYKIK